MVERYRSNVQCGLGCSDCCHQTFRISEIEGEFLRTGLEAADPDTRADIVSRARAYRENERLPCPVLSKEGGCRLYAHRPRICRKYGIPLWHPDRPHEVRTCPLNFKDVADIDATLILDPQARWAEDWIRLRHRLGLGPQTKETIAARLLER